MKNYHLFYRAVLAGSAAVFAIFFSYSSVMGASDSWKFDSQAFEERLVQDWLLQDAPDANVRAALFTTDSNEAERALAQRVLDALESDSGAGLKTRLQALVDAETPGTAPEWQTLYRDACRERRAERLANVQETTPSFIFTKHYVMGASHYAYTEDVTDEAYKDISCNRQPGGQLCLATFEPDGSLRYEVLVDSLQGTIRDPDVSFDGKRVLFSMRNNYDSDDFHLYEYDTETRTTRQLTFGAGVADIEPIYLPNGDLLFTSTRCGQSTDCWWTEVANLYTCDGQGRFMRRVGVDQVSVNYPKLLSDGRVVYTRWDYNDRGHIYVQPLFQMNPDGTGQTEFYGNNSYFPTAILHARGVPGSEKVVGIIGGHHAYQHGKLALIDRSKGTQGATGVTCLAPTRPSEDVKIDRFGQDGELFQYPYPLDDSTLLCAYLPEGTQDRTYATPFGVYWFDYDGNRELLAFDPAISCGQPIPFVERETPFVRASQVDLTKTTGEYYVQDVYFGPGLEGVPRGAIKKLRVVALEFRPHGIGWNWNFGEAGDSIVTTPISVGGGTWDVKRVLGETPVEEDGSAYFEVPAMTPVYFQLLDRNGDVVQTMRSWSTLQPGERFACNGCHERKDSSIQNAELPASLALQRGVVKLAPVLTPGEGYMRDAGFSYMRDVQPILDRYCVACHSGRALSPDHPARIRLRADKYFITDPKDEYAKILASQKRNFVASYINLTKRGQNKNEYMNWWGVQDRPDMAKPYSYGAATSPLIAFLRGRERWEKDADLPGRPEVRPELFDAHEGLSIPDDAIKTLALWIDLLVPYCGTYEEANCWLRGERAAYEYYLAQRTRNAEINAENIAKAIERDATGKTFELSDFTRFDRGGIFYRTEFIKEFFEKKVPSKLTDGPNERRNLALNPEDVQCDSEKVPAYPHASADTEFGYLSSCAAVNAIDGDPDTAWRPNRTAFSNLTVDFGVEVELDELAATFSESAPDGWKRVSFLFDDGDVAQFELTGGAERQTFKLERPRKCSRVTARFVSKAPTYSVDIKTLPDDRFPEVVEFEAWGVVAR